MARRKLPPLNALKAFEAAGRHLSFTNAADELAVTQAAVSHQIRSLEDWLGCKLFRRLNRAIELTEQGDAYLPAVTTALDGLVLATRRVLEREGPAVLTVSVLPSFAAKWLVPRLGAIYSAHSEIEIRITASERLVDFGRDDVDFGVRYGFGGWPGLVSERFLTEEIYPVCSPALLQGPVPLARPEDLKHHILLHDDTRDDWRMWLLAAGVAFEGFDPRRGPGFDDSSMMIQAAVEGQGVAIARSALADKDIVGGRLVKPFDGAVPAQMAYYAVYLKEREDEAKIRAFADWLKHTVAQEAGLML